VVPTYGADVGSEDRVAATRLVYDATADAYATAIGTALNPDFEGPIDRALLVAFAELVTDAAGPVADLGCGPGRVAAFLAERGLTTVAVDLSPGMLAVGRAAHPHLAFAAGDLLRLPLATAVLAGAACWYSVIHTPPEQLQALFAEVARTLTSGSPLLVAFQTADDERVDRPDAHGSGHPLSSFRHHVDTVGRALSAAGLDVRSTTVRQPTLAHESTPQAFIFAAAG
jgi:SAM-dependent methyltransferase